MWPFIDGIFTSCLYKSYFKGKKHMKFTISFFNQEWKILWLKAKRFLTNQITGDDCNLFTVESREFSIWTGLQQLFSILSVARGEWQVNQS